MTEFIGDANNDGRIDSLDIPVGLRVVSGLEEITVNDNQRLDANGDGVMNVSDLSAIYDHINCKNLIDGVIY
jgi:hypothetical protein